MSQSLEAPTAPLSDAFVDRRNTQTDSSFPNAERRQFANSHSELSPDAQELARAIDEYKLRHRRRFITYEEMLGVISELGYSK
ncbi:MAG: hypothetical protein VX988_12065 [Planctomycetota bacterium]|nr:hypothetical protein [Planctomycetota bacterium]